MTKYIILILTLGIIVCQPSSEISESNYSVDSIKYHDGFLVNFFSSDTSQIDSSYRYIVKFDTLILTDRVIENNSLLIDKINFTSIGDSIKISLDNAEYEYLALVTEDTVIWGPSYPNNSITISKIDSAILKDFYIQNWGIIALGDTIGSNGVQASKLIKVKKN